MTPEFSFETKARTLQKLATRVSRFKVPELLYFAVDDWRDRQAALVSAAAEKFGGSELIVRSSAWDEDGSTWGLAGQYESVPRVRANDEPGLIAAVETVVASYGRDDRAAGRDEIIVQQLLVDPVMSGVLFTHELDTGAPYYVINYDDESGRTDTVTSGGTEYANRTLYVHRGALGAVRSRRFQALLAAVTELEEVTGSQFLDVEFGLDAEFVPYLLQVRLITTQANWNRGLAHQVDAALDGVQRFVRVRLRPLPGVHGEQAVLGQMPDWNPAEMIGRAPRRLASSLYRWLITDSAWRDARAEMGYAAPAGQPLMVLLAEQPYIDVRLSFHSYLPGALEPTIGDKLVNAWLDRLRANPHLHDKIEFDVAITAYTFDIEDRIETLIPGVLTADERARFIEALRQLTSQLVTGARASIESALERVGELEHLHELRRATTARPSPGMIRMMLEECLRLGTLPFSVLARHAFIARSILLSLVARDVFSSDDAERFSRSVRTVASEIVSDMRRLASGDLSREDFMGRYGHLRPGTYDLLSPRYDQAREFFDGVQPSPPHVPEESFVVGDDQRDAIGRLLSEAGLGEISASQLLDYLRAAPAAREYAKFVFTRSLSDVLELVAGFGEHVGLSRAELSHIALGDILDVGVESDAAPLEERLRRLAREGAEAQVVTRAVRLPQLLTGEEGVHVVPFQISHPNFITTGVVRALCVRLRASDVAVPPLEGRVALIEGADPGFDWIFAHGVCGLVTAFGGANSHMAIRCAEFGIPAAIGCGEQIFERIEAVGGVEINCGEGHIRAVRLR